LPFIGQGFAEFLPCLDVFKFVICFVVLSLPNVSTTITTTHHLVFSMVRWAILLANVQTASHVSVKSKKHFFELEIKIDKNNPALICYESKSKSNVNSLTLMMAN